MSCTDCYSPAVRKSPRKGHCCSRWWGSGVRGRMHSVTCQPFLSPTKKSHMHQCRLAPKSIRLREMCAKIILFFCISSTVSFAAFHQCLVRRRHSIHFLKNEWVNGRMSKWESLTPWKVVVQWVEYRDNINIFQPLMFCSQAASLGRSTICTSGPSLDTPWWSCNVRWGRGGSCLPKVLFFCQ